MSLKTLEEHDAERAAIWKRGDGNEPLPNGIACPKCGKELLDVQRAITVSGRPPKKNVWCPACDWRGTRVE